MIPVAAQVIVLAKAPVPGRVKTRLTPPFTPHQAALLAEAALADTLDAAARTPFARHLLVIADPGDIPGRLAAGLPPRFHVTPQRGGGLDERIAAALHDAYASLPVPAVLIGMDTPQITPALLAAAAAPLASGEAEAALGPAADGGFWLLGLRKPDPRVVLGVPMSQPDTGRVQMERLAEAGLRVRQLPELTDIDTAQDAYRVASEAPEGRFAAMLSRVGPNRHAGLATSATG